MGPLKGEQSTAPQVLLANSSLLHPESSSVSRREVNALAAPEYIKSTGNQPFLKEKYKNVAVLGKFFPALTIPEWFSEYVI